MAAIPSNLLPYNTESIETSTAGWLLPSNCVLSRSTAHFREGVASLQMQSTASGAMSCRIAAAIILEDGTRYVSFGGGVLSSNNLATSVTMQWLDDTVSVIHTDVVPLTGSSAWQWISSGVSVPAGARSVNMILGATATASGQQVFWDRMWIVPQPVWNGQMLPLDAEFNDTPTVQWTGGVNCATAVGPVGTFYPNWGTALQLTATAAGDMQATPKSGPLDVVVGDEYMLVAAMAQTSGSAQTGKAELRWLAADGTTIVGTSAVGSFPCATGGWTIVQAIGTCPPGAAKLLPVLRPQAATAGAVWFADQIGVVPTAGSYTRPGNLLGYNGQGAEMDASAWQAVSGCSLSISTTEVFQGSYALAIAADGTGDAVVELADPVPVTPGQSYQFAPVLWPASALTHTLGLTWLAADGTTVDTTSQDFDLGGGAPRQWYRDSSGGLCPAGATHLRVTFTIPATDAETWYLDDIFVGPGGLAAVATPLRAQYGVQISLQGLTTESMTTYDLERVQPDGGLVAVRGQSGDLMGQPINADTEVVEDYEAPLGVQVRYYVTTYGNGDATLAFTTTAIVLDPPPRNYMVVKDPTLPALTMAVLVNAPADWTRKASQAFFQPRGASLPIPRYDKRQGRTGTLPVSTLTSSDRQRLEGLLASGNTLLMQAPTDTDWDDIYVQVGDTPEPRTVPQASDQTRQWSLPLTEVARPVGGMAGTAGRTWQDVLDNYATWRDVYNAYATWGGVLTGLEGT